MPVQQPPGSTTGSDPGLFGAGSDTVGLFVRAYAGGIANALVFGLAAARTSVGAPFA